MKLLKNYKLNHTITGTLLYRKTHIPPDISKGVIGSTKSTVISIDKKELIVFLLPINLNILLDKLKMVNNGKPSSTNKCPQRWTNGKNIPD